MIIFKLPVLVDIFDDFDGNSSTSYSEEEETNSKQHTTCTV